MATKACKHLSRPFDRVSLPAVGGNEKQSLQALVPLPCG
jgi:hypothetical protein